MLRVAVLASGRGSNLQALIDARHAGHLPVELVLVGSDQSEARALQLAAEHGIASQALDPRGFASRAAFDAALFDLIAAHAADLVVLAGFMRILDGQVLAPWAGRIINIHPSLLPKYRGLHTHRRALQAGDREHGASVHYVTAELDGGPLIAQARIAVAADDSEDSLAARLLPLEHRLLVSVVAAIAAGQITCQNGRACLDGQPLPAPLQLASHGFGLCSAAPGQAAGP